MPAALLSCLLLIPLRGQEACQKQVGIGHRGRSATRNMSLFHIVAFCAAFMLIPLRLSGDDQATAAQGQNPRFNDPGNLIEVGQRKEILDAAQAIPDRKDPVLWIDVISKTEVDVSTGVVRAPLDGSGRIFKLSKEGGKWIYIKEDFHRSWVAQNTPNGPVHLTPTRRHAGCLVASLPASVAPTVRGR